MHHALTVAPWERCRTLESGQTAAVQLPEAGLLLRTRDAQPRAATGLCADAVAHTRCNSQPHNDSHSMGNKDSGNRVCCGQLMRSGQLMRTDCVDEHRQAT